MVRSGTGELAMDRDEKQQVQINHELNNRKILDLGCGDGDFLKRFITLETPKEIHGYDFSEVGIGKAKIGNELILRNIPNIYRNISFEDLKFELETIRREILKLEKGATCMITEGKHGGTVAKLVDIVERHEGKAAEAKLQGKEGAEFITVAKYLFVVDGGAYE